MVPEDTFKWEPALPWYCSVLRKKPLCHAKTSPQNTALWTGGWMAELLCWTAIGKTRYMWLQSPVRVACGKFAIGCFPAHLIFYSVCITVSLSVWRGFAAVWPTAVTQRSDEQGRRTPVTAACWHSARAEGWLEQRPILEDPRKREVRAVKPALSYVEGSTCHSWGQSLLCWARTSSCGSVFGIFHLQES